MSMLSRVTAVLLLLAPAGAFVVPRPITSLGLPVAPGPVRYMTEASGSADEDRVETEDKAVPEMVEEEESGEASEEEEEPQEDPELVALKEEIAELEKQVKEKRRQANDVADRAEEYTKTGYARKVAEMENMRRARSMLNSSSKYSATAATLAEFLPIMDKLEDLKQKYSEDEFGKLYNALPGAMKTAFMELGVTDYTVTEGVPVDKMRMTVIDSEHSDSFAVNTVIRPLSAGMELQGNIIRAAEVVSSLGPEKIEEEETPAEGDDVDAPETEAGGEE